MFRKVGVMLAHDLSVVHALLHYTTPVQPCGIWLTWQTNRRFKVMEEGVGGTDVG